MQASNGKKAKIGGNKKKFDDDWSENKQHNHDSERRNHKNIRNRKRETEEL